MSDIATRVKKIIVDKLGVDEAEVTSEASFTNDLGADSLDTVELIMEFEKEFNISIPDEQAETITTGGQAVTDAGISKNNIDPDRVGVIFASGIGGLITFQEEVMNFAKGDGTPRFNPFFIPKMILDIAAGNISMRHGFRGPNYAVVSACASSTNGIIDAFNTIRLGDADIILSGGSESVISEAGVGGFNAMKA